MDFKTRGFAFSNSLKTVDPSCKMDLVFGDYLGDCYCVILGRGWEGQMGQHSLSSPQDFDSVIETGKCLESARFLCSWHEFE